MAGFAHRLLRANPAYELVRWELLDGPSRAVLESEADVYGALCPRPGVDLVPRCATLETALLFLSLTDPAPLPAYVDRQLGGEATAVVSRLLLDGVLEVELDGEFVSGSRANAALSPSRGANGGGRIGALSRDALQYGQSLAFAGSPEATVADRLYSFGRRPLTLELADRFDGPGLVESSLFDASQPRVRAALAAAWERVRLDGGAPWAWIVWRTRRRHASTGRGGTTYKLYVSPSIEDIGDAFAVVATTLGTMPGIKGFKVASDARGLCRPDKLVAYFERLEDLHEGASAVRAELHGAGAQPVPFTAAITSDGLLSWGLDPPQVPPVRCSWRRWVCAHLGEYLVGFVAERTSDPLLAAVERLRLDGVDTDAWMSVEGAWVGSTTSS